VELEMKIRVLVIGLGSMGKRRVRNLQALGDIEVSGFDVRADRNLEASSKYQITTFDDIEKAFKDVKPKAVIISTPPQLHMTYANMCFNARVPCFIEASVTDTEEIRKLSKKAKEASLVIAPSCTMRYFPGPQKVKELLREGVIGLPLSVNYQTGQYLPDWHPWEDIQDFYVSKRESGGAREIVPFELTWLNDLFSHSVKALASVVSKQTDMNADIDDIYHCLLQYDSGILLNLTVEVISRPLATREMLILGSKGKIKFSSDSNSVSYCNLETDGWVEYTLEEGTVEQQYINPEEPYINEMKDFIRAAVTGEQNLFPNNLQDDLKVLEVLEGLEEAAK
jgi:predicted dehydrogenase